MLINQTETAERFTPELNAEAIQSIIANIKSADVKNALFESENGEAIFASTDPAVIIVLRHLLNESLIPEDSE